MASLNHLVTKPQPLIDELGEALIFIDKILDDSGAKISVTDRKKDDEFGEREVYQPLSKLNNLIKAFCPEGGQIRLPTQEDLDIGGIGRSRTTVYNFSDQISLLDSVKAKLGDVRDLVEMGSNNVANLVPETAVGLAQTLNGLGTGDTFFTPTKDGQLRVHAFSHFGPNPNSEKGNKSLAEVLTLIHSTDVCMDFSSGIYVVPEGDVQAMQQRMHDETGLNTVTVEQVRRAMAELIIYSGATHVGAVESLYNDALKIAEGQVTVRDEGQVTVRVNDGGTAHELQVRSFEDLANQATQRGIDPDAVAESLTGNVQRRGR